MKVYVPRKQAKNYKKLFFMPLEVKQAAYFNDIKVQYLYCVER